MMTNSKTWPGTPRPPSSCRYPSVFPWGTGWSVHQYIYFVRCHHVASRPLNCMAQARRWKPVNVRTISLLPHAFLVIWIFNTFLPDFVNLSHDPAFSCQLSLIITINCNQPESVRVNSNHKISCPAPEEMTQLVKCLPCKQRDLSSDLQRPHTKPRMEARNSKTPELGQQRQIHLQGLLVFQPNQSASSRSGERTLPLKQGEK